MLIATGTGVDAEARYQKACRMVLLVAMLIHWLAAGMMYKRYFPAVRTGPSNWPRVAMIQPISVHPALDAQPQPNLIAPPVN